MDKEASPEALFFATLGMTWLRRVASRRRMRVELLGMLVNLAKKHIDANDYSYAMAA